jgi:hypothetical protein
MAARTLVLTLIVVAILAGGLLFANRWRVEPVGGERIPTSRPAPYAAPECQRMCAEATLPFPGLTAGMSPDQFHALVERQLGTESANSLLIALTDSKIIILDGKLFFPTCELCKQPALTGECAAACRRWNPRCG